MEENESRQEIQEIEQISAKELKRQETARKLFVEEGNPMPVRKVVGFWDIASVFGIEVVLRVASTIGAAVVSATAVGAVMEIMAIKLQESFSAQTDVSTRGLFYWSMLAIEGGLMASGMTEGRKNNSLKDLKWTLWAGFGTAISAGFMRSFTLTGNSAVENFFVWLFAVLVAVAGPVISYYGSENFGYILKEIQALQNIFDEEWQEKIKEWGKLFHHAYPRIAKQVFKEDRRMKVNYDDNETPVLESEEKQVKENIRAKVKDYLKQMSVLPSQVGDKAKGALLSPAEIADALGLVGKERDAVRTYMGQFRIEEANGKW